MAVTSAVLEVYHRPHDPDRPVAFVNETLKRILPGTPMPRPANSEWLHCCDYEYERNGNANLLMMFAPLQAARDGNLPAGVIAIDRETVRRSGHLNALGDHTAQGMAVGWP